MSKDTKEEAISKAAADVVNNLGEGKTIQDLLSDPAAIADMSKKLSYALNSAVTPTPKVRRRIKALKNVQKSTTYIEANFYKEVQHLEAKYHKLYQPFYDQRKAIVDGSYEPTASECHWEDDTEPDEPSQDQDAGEDHDVKGIPDFWLTAIRNCEIFTDVIKECDEDVLRHLYDIKIVYADENGLDFTIEYHFSENEWFTNKVLTMTYYVNCEVSDEDPWDFEGATIYACQGCSIDWKKGKNLTVKTVKKKSKSKGKGQAKVVTKQVPNETFFNTFSFTKSDKNSSESDQDELTQALSDNFTLAEFMRDRLVPRGILFFTGEATEEDEYDDDYEEEDEDGDGDGGDDYNAQLDLKAAKPPECKQQ